MSPPAGNGDSGQAVAALFTQLPTRLKLLLAFGILGFKAAIFAARDTIIAKVFALVLSNLGLYGYYLPGPAVFLVCHLYLFLFRQASWRKTLATVRRFISRDDADDDMLTQIYIDASDTGFYIFLSLIFRNVGAIWEFCIAFFVAVYSVSQIFVVPGVLWFCLIDNPRETFFVEAEKIWNFIGPKLHACVRKLGRFFVIVVHKFLRFCFKLRASIIEYRDKRTERLAASLEKYEYSALKDGEFRLLRLSKLTPLSPVHCELVHVHLDGAPKFETISYTWGARRTLKALIVTGKRLEVSGRVYEIVHDRASSLMTRFLWIDSICINQGDDGEKSSQVRLMRNIYGSSYHTIVWLGHAPDANDAIGLLAHIRRRMDFDDPVQRASMSLMDLTIPSTAWPALNNLIKHEYWVRCWIIQEISISKKVIVSYGGELITWDYFSSIMQALFHSDPNSVWHMSKIYQRSLTLPPFDAGVQISSLGNVRDAIQREGSVELFDLLIASINSIATDDRDNIFAVHGISTAADSGDIMPDYSSSIERPFLQTAEYLLKQEHPSRILHLAGIGYYRNGKIQASWVPDWSSRRLSRMFWRFPAESPYCSSGAVDEQPNWLLSPDGVTLTIRGIRVDTIKELGPQFFGVSENGVPKTSLFPGSFKNYHETRIMALGGGRSELYPTGISLAEAYWRTLIGDRAPPGTRPSDTSFFTYYKAMERSIELMMTAYGPEMNPENPIVSPELRQSIENSMLEIAVDTGRFANMSGPHTRERRVAFTTGGYMGMVPPYSEIGDVVFIIPGTQVPFLMRRQQDTSGNIGDSSEGKWRLVGESYFHGMMDGEMMLRGLAEQDLEIC